MPNEPIDVEAGEDLDGHGPLLLGRAPPVHLLGSVRVAEVPWKLGCDRTSQSGI